MLSRIFVGYDSTEHRAYEVCVKSLLRRASCPVQIIPLRLDWLQGLGIYWRPTDPLASTEFTYSRFLIPTLCGYQGRAMFVDCDFVFLADVVELLALADDHFAVQVVQQDYRPTATEKMGGAVQTQYTRKNWASLVLWNAGHEGNRRLTAYDVNMRPREWLKEFKWLADREIGALPIEWNVLSGYTICDKPKALHLTTGIRSIHGPHSVYNEEHQRLWEQENAA